MISHYKKFDKLIKNDEEIFINRLVYEIKMAFDDPMILGQFLSNTLFV